MCTSQAGATIGLSLYVCIIISISCASGGHGAYCAIEYRLSTNPAPTETKENTLKLPSSAAIELLAEVKTVAFAPPDACLESAKGADIAIQKCGEAMAALEQAAAEAGLQVVSWQTLRGNEPALNYARRSNIDILFELNRLGPDDYSEDILRKGRLTFFQYEEDNKGDDDPRRYELPVSDMVKGRCAALLLKEFPTGTPSGVVLDVKMVSVRTGMVLWNYRHLFRVPVGSSEETGIRYFDASGNPDSVLCKTDLGSPFAPTIDVTPKSKSASESEDKSAFASFDIPMSGQRSSSSTLRRSAEVAASEFVELLVYMQGLSPNEKRVTLRSPSRQKGVQGQPSSGCATVAAWLKSGQLKSVPLEYSRNCPKA